MLAIEIGNDTKYDPFTERNPKFDQLVTDKQSLQPVVAKELQLNIEEDNLIREKNLMQKLVTSNRSPGRQHNASDGFFQSNKVPFQTAAQGSDILYSTVSDRGLLALSK